MISINRNDPPQDYLTPPESCGLFMGLAEGLKKCEMPDQEVVMLIHEWVMNGIRKRIAHYDLDPVEAMTGNTPLSLRATSGETWLKIDLIFEKKVIERLHLNFKNNIP